MNKTPSLAAFDYSFPPELIAQHTVGKGKARILQVSLSSSDLVEITPWGIVDMLQAGDCLVVNNTKVIPARLKGVRPSGGEVEALLLHPQAEVNTWQAMVKPGRAFKPGATVEFQGTPAQVVQVNDDGTRVLRFELGAQDFMAWLDQVGHIPLPPYIERADEVADKDDYQTVFAKNSGAVAAPTASLHFSSAMLDALRAKGVHIAEVTLHVGAGTFQNIQCDDYTKHQMHREYYEISATAAHTINSAQQNGQRVLCVGTTTARVLETVADDHGVIVAGKGYSEKFIYPGYQWKFVRNLLTNFHWPRSSLILLVAALVGSEPLLAAYNHAVAQKFKLFSYGDGMLIISD